MLLSRFFNGTFKLCLILFVGFFIYCVLISVQHVSTTSGCFKYAIQTSLDLISLGWTGWIRFELALKQQAPGFKLLFVFL